MPTDLSPDEVERSHRWHAAECNNLAWQLSDLASRTPHQDREMLDAAHASAFHWARMGNELHAARAEMLLGHVHAALGLGLTALEYAQHSYDFLVAHMPPDWEAAFAHAVLAHAAFAAGEKGLHRQYHASARALGEAIADPEDREIFFRTFRLIPGP